MPQSAAEYARSNQGREYVPGDASKPAAKSRPIIARGDLRRTLMDLFSTPEGRRQEMGRIIDEYAAKLDEAGHENYRH